MRSLLLTLLVFCLVTTSVKGQMPYLNFDAHDTLWPHLIEIDTFQYPNNKWQVGRPTKAIFDSALSLPNAIVTDTANAYASYDTSVFILKVSRTIGDDYPFHHLWLRYMLDIDTDAVVRLEISTDSGNYWYDTRDTMPPYWSWYGSPPDLSIPAHLWKELHMYPDVWGLSDVDTLLFRFTFISGATAGKDGWMIDDISIWYWYPDGIPQTIASEVAFFPNPATGHLSITHKEPIRHVVIYGALGQVSIDHIYSPPLSNSVVLPLFATMPLGVGERPLAAGTYFVNVNGSYAGKFVKQ